VVDARGGAMAGRRPASAVRVVVPPKAAHMPVRITCRFVRRDKPAKEPPIAHGQIGRIVHITATNMKFFR
jgi:ankyrin